MSEFDNKEATQQTDSLEVQWLVKLDKDKCTLCEACGRICPTKALFVVRKDEDMSLHFRQTVCIGCAGDRSCAVICPEKAIEVLKTESVADQNSDVVLMHSEMLECSYCHEYFCTDLKVDSLETKGLGHGVDKVFCPVCKRKHLVVKLIEDVMVPGSTAKYRSARDIQRRARFFRLFKEGEED